MSTSQAPRDSVAQTQLFVPVDATGTDFYAQGKRYGTQVAVLSDTQPETGHPFSRSSGAWDPRCLRWHALQRPVPGLGIDDNRLSVQVVNDYEGEYSDARPGDAPYGQPEVFTALNRSTREVDVRGRVALPSSHRRITDSEDDRYALSLTCRSVPLRGATNEVELILADAAPPPANVRFHERGSVGGVSYLSEAVSVGGVTFFGGAAAEAARWAQRVGVDPGAAASAAVAGRSMPRPPPAPEPDPKVVLDPLPDPSGHSVPLLDRPAGYVRSPVDRVGLLGTLVVPEGASGHYFEGREGTRIGPLPWRHDAQVSMGPDQVGRIVFVSDDAASVERGTGRKIKGEMWADSSRANKDTDLGLETLQWRPVVAVDADLPPRYPPPPPPWEPPPEEEEEDEEGEEEDEPEGGGPGRGAGKRRRPLRRKAGVPKRPKEWILVGGVGIFDLPPVKDPAGQARDLSGPGIPCPNKTAGVRVKSDEESFDLIRVPGGYVQWHGHPALTPAGDGLVVGGIEHPLRREPKARVGDAPVTPFKAGAELKKQKKPTGVVVLPPLGGDRGVPRGYGEKYERARRAWRRNRAEEERIRDLEEIERRARDAGRECYADRVARARARLEKRRQEREERLERRRRYKERKREEAAERKRKREERYSERRRQARLRRERRRQRRREHKQRKRPSAPQGGYMIDLRDPDLGSLTPEQRRLLEEDVARGWLDPKVLGLAGEPAPPRAMGEWNVANAPLPFVGQVGSLEQWANVATYQLRALQRILLGAFGGPDYLASNLALKDVSGTGHLLAGCGPKPVLTVRSCGGVALCIEGDLIVKGRITEQDEPTREGAANTRRPDRDDARVEPGA